MIPALEVRGLGYLLPGKGKGDGGPGRFLVQDVSFAVGAGETLVLLGRSGSGKTTTLKLINRLLTQDAGAIYVDGRRILATSAIDARAQTAGGRNALYGRLVYTRSVPHRPQDRQAATAALPGH